VALIDDLGGYNVPWRNPEQKGDDLLQLSTKEGMRLENFYTFKYCSPTRSSFLSARFACHVNQYNGMACPGCDGCDGGGIDLRMKLLPQKLADKHYRSYMVGKGHIGGRSVGHLPINRGFDHHLGFLGGGEDHWQCSGHRHSCDGNASSTNGVHCQCDDAKPGSHVDLWEDDAPAYGLNGTYSCNLYSGKAVALVEDHAKNYPSQGMFLYLPYHDVHEPYEALDSFRDPSCPDKGRQTMQAMMSCVSEGTGNVTRALKKAGMWETTLFLWSSDNGGPQYWLGNNCESEWCYFATLPNSPFPQNVRDFDAACCRRPASRWKRH
jgi:arylsulfatase I/J